MEDPCIVDRSHDSHESCDESERVIEVQDAFDHTSDLRFAGNELRHHEELPLVGSVIIGVNYGWDAP
jgi:hypothetical protein